MSLRRSRQYDPLMAAVLFAVLVLGGCLPSALRSAAHLPDPVLHPQSARATGTVWLQPRYAREPRNLPAPGLLEPGDWVETGAGAKAELALPQARLRLYENTRVQIHFQFEERTAVSRQLRLEHGEVLVTRPEATTGPFRVESTGLHVDVSPGASVVVASDGRVHRTACYVGQAEARNVRVRGQTVIRLREGLTLTVDDDQTLALLEKRKLADDWERWERKDVVTAGLLPPSPGPPDAAAPPQDAPPGAQPAQQPR